MERDGRRELANDLATGLFNLALARRTQGQPALALNAAREARSIRESLVANGWPHLAKSLADARALEASLQP